MGSGPMPTIKEVARLAGVSASTVSKVLNGTGSISKPLRERVLEAAASLGYAPHPVARSLRSGSTRILGLLVADIANPFFLQLVETIEHKASQHGYSVLLCNSAEEPEREKRNLGMLVAQRVDGAFVIPTRTGWMGRVSALQSLPFPSVQVDRTLDGLECDAVVLENRLAGKLAADHLLDLGHRRIGILVGSLDHPLGRHRFEGVRSAFTERGLAFDDVYLRNNIQSDEDALLAADELLSMPTPPTAIYTTFSKLTFALLRTARMRGVHIPDQLSLVATDETPWGALIEGGVTTVVQPTEAIAEAAIKAVMANIESRRNGQPHHASTTVLTPTLIVRGTTSKPETSR